MFNNLHAYYCPVILAPSLSLIQIQIQVVNFALMLLAAIRLLTQSQDQWNHNLYNPSNVQQSTGSPLSSGSYTDVLANPDLNGQLCPEATSRYPASHTIARPQSLQAIGSNVEQLTCLPFFIGFSVNISANLNLNGLELCPDATSRHPSSITQCKMSTNESYISITFVKQLTYKFLTSYYIFNQTTMAK